MKVHLLKYIPEPKKAAAFAPVICDFAAGGEELFDNFGPNFLSCRSQDGKFKHKTPPKASDFNE